MKTDLESQEAGAPFGRGAWGPPARGRPLPIGENRSESMQKSGRPFIGGPPMKDSSLPIGAERSESMQKARRPFIGGPPMKVSAAGMQNLHGSPKQARTCKILVVYRDS